MKITTIQSKAEPIFRVVFVHIILMNVLEDSLLTQYAKSPNKLLRYLRVCIAKPQ